MPLGQQTSLRRGARAAARHASGAGASAHKAMAMLLMTLQLAVTVDAFAVPRIAASWPRPEGVSRVRGSR